MKVDRQDLLTGWLGEVGEREDFWTEWLRWTTLPFPQLRTAVSSTSWGGVESGEVHFRDTPETFKRKDESMVE